MLKLLKLLKLLKRRLKQTNKIHKTNPKIADTGSLGDKANTFTLKENPMETYNPNEIAYIIFKNLPTPIGINPKTYKGQFVSFLDLYNLPAIHRIEAKDFIYQNFEINIAAAFSPESIKAIDQEFKIEICHSEIISGCERKLIKLTTSNGEPAALVVITNDTLKHDKLIINNQKNTERFLALLTNNNPNINKDNYLNSDHIETEELFAPAAALINNFNFIHNRLNASGDLQSLIAHIKLTA